MIWQKRKHIVLVIEAFIRLFLCLLFLVLEDSEPFVREIQPEEEWLYRNPVSSSYVRSYHLWIMVATLPILVILLTFLLTRDTEDSKAAFLAFTLGLPLNGVITDTIKLTVGRHRPDFIFRCWPDGVVPENAFSGLASDLKCKGDPDIIREGRKSFPSGHSSFSFYTWFFLFLYISGKLGTFRCSHKPTSSWRLLVSLGLILVPSVIAISRTADYHHHWQDVTVGSLLGIAIAWVVYRQYYPALSSASSNLPLQPESVKMRSISRNVSSAKFAEQQV